MCEKGRRRRLVAPGPGFIGIVQEAARFLPVVRSQRRAGEAGVDAADQIGLR